jgi:uncharacterized caspase-like protein
MISLHEPGIGNNVLIERDIKHVSITNSTTAYTVDAERNNTQPQPEHDLEDIRPAVIIDDVLRQSGFTYHDYFKF